MIQCIQPYLMSCADVFCALFNQLRHAAYFIACAYLTNVAVAESNQQSNLVAFVPSSETVFMYRIDNG